MSERIFIEQKNSDVIFICQHLARWIKIIIEKSHTLKQRAIILNVSMNVKKAERQISLY